MDEMTTSFSDRLKRWRESAGLTQTDLALRVDVSLSTIQRWERGDLPKGAELLALDALGFDPTWGLTGRVGAGQPQTHIAASPPAATADLVEIRHYAVGISAGNGRKPPDFDDFENLVLPAEWVRRVLRRSPANLVLAHAEGSSMEPTIVDHDLIVIDTADQRLTSDRIYALLVGDDLLVKRVKRTLRGQILLQPDNSAHPTEELTEDLTDTVRVLGRVVWHGGSLE